MATLGGNERGWIETQGGLSFKDGVTTEELVKAYDECADKYDKVFLNPKTILGGYAQISHAMAELYPNERDDIIVLDVGAGTGNVGAMLKSVGFTKLEALEPSSKLLAIAEKKDVYRHLYNVFLTDQPVDLPSDCYDAVVMNGVIFPGTFPRVAFKELVRIVKPGGYIVICNRVAHLEETPGYGKDWDLMVSGMEQQGTWKLLRKQRYPGHYLDKDGWLMIFQIC